MERVASDPSLAVLLRFRAILSRLALVVRAVLTALLLFFRQLHLRVAALALPVLPLETAALAAAAGVILVIQPLALARQGKEPMVELAAPQLWAALVAAARVLRAQIRHLRMVLRAALVLPMRFPVHLPPMLAAAAVVGTMAAAGPQVLAAVGLVGQETIAALLVLTTQAAAAVVAADPFAVAAALQTVVAAAMASSLSVICINRGRDMAYFAQLNQATYVTQVLAVDDSSIGDLPFPESQPVGQAYLQNIFGQDTVWAQTSDDASFRYNYAGPGFTFDAAAQPDGAFIAPYPGEGWVLDTNTYKWVKEVTPSDPPMVL